MCAQYNMNTTFLCINVGVGGWNQADLLKLIQNSLKKIASVLYQNDHQTASTFYIKTKIFSRANEL